MARQPRTFRRTISDCGRQIEYIQRTFLLRFPDQITVRFISKDSRTSTLANYSRSTYGYWDFGTNKARVHSLLAELQEEISAS